MSKVWLGLSRRDQKERLEALPPPLHSAHVTQNVLEVYTLLQTLVLERLSATPLSAISSALTFRPRRRSSSVCCAPSISARSLTRSQSIGAQLGLGRVHIGSHDRNVHVPFDRGPRTMQGTSSRHELRATMRGADAPPVESGAHAKESAAYECTCPYAGQSAAESLVPYAFCNALALVCGAHARLLLLLSQLPTRSLPCASSSLRPAITINAISCARATDHPKRERAEGEGRGLQLQLQVIVTPARAEFTSLWSAVYITYACHTGDSRVANQSARCTLDGEVLVRGECSRAVTQKPRVHPSETHLQLDLRLSDALEGVALRNLHPNKLSCSDLRVHIFFTNRNFTLSEISLGVEELDSGFLGNTVFCSAPNTAS